MDKSLSPLPHEWMLVSIIGFLISAFEVYGWSKTWGFTFCLFFGIIFVASVVNMNAAGTSQEDLLELSIHHEHVRAGKHRQR